MFISRETNVLRKFSFINISYICTEPTRQQTDNLRNKQFVSYACPYTMKYSCTHVQLHLYKHLAVSQTYSFDFLLLILLLLLLLLILLKLISFHVEYHPSMVKFVGGVVSHHLQMPFPIKGVVSACLCLHGDDL